jgi:hypothetical protein
VLDTLNRYVQGSPGNSRSGLQDWRPGAGLDPRFRTIITLSICGHLVFYASIVALDWWVYHIIMPRHRVETAQLVKVTDLATSPGEGAPLRAPPEFIEWLDTHHVKFEAGSDDTKLLPRSPNPGTSTTPGLRQAGKGSGDESTSSGGPGRATVADHPKSQPPGAQTIQPPEVRAPDGKAPAILPVSPVGQPPSPAPLSEKQQSRQGGQSGENSGEASRLSLRALEQSKYVAVVRQKIWRINDRIAPRGYQDILAGEVVSVFSLIVERSGRVRSIRLNESCGYSALDKIARQAISLAEPFEGYPAELPDTFEMTVWVRYTPSH